MFPKCQQTQYKEFLIAKRSRTLIDTKPNPERVMLAGVSIKKAFSSWSIADSLSELGRLAHTAGAEVIGTITQQLNSPSRTYLGKGKLEELKQIRLETPFDAIVIDDELTPTQQLTLEESLGDNLKVIDRTALILDIFATHARTREGRLQVALAQAEYLLPRIAGQWSHLERLGGGIGTRGPGESQIETDRRIIGQRIHSLKNQLEQVRHQRNLHRKNRIKGGLPIISLVGYTNAGKSSLLNTLTKAQVTVKDLLFSTLDPVTRRVRLPKGQPILITDTVGFIQKLPTALVAAFRATLEELQNSDLLLHVVDITHHNAAEQVDVVNGVLKDLGLSSKPQILALNKVDLLQTPTPIGPLLSNAVFTSTVRRIGIEELLTTIESFLGRSPSIKSIRNPRQ